MAAQLVPFLQCVPHAADVPPPLSPSKPKLARAAFPPAADLRVGRVFC